MPMGGEVPVFERPKDRRYVVRQWLFGDRRSLPAWSRLLLDGEGLASTLDVNGAWEKITSLRFVLNMNEMHVSQFARYLREVASRGPKKGEIAVLYRGYERRGLAAQYLTFGLVHGFGGDFGVPPGEDLASWCPTEV